MSKIKKKSHLLQNSPISYLCSDPQLECSPLQTYFNTRHFRGRKQLFFPIAFGWGYSHPYPQSLPSHVDMSTRIVSENQSRQQYYRFPSMCPRQLLSSDFQAVHQHTTQSPVLITTRRNPSQCNPMRANDKCESSSDKKCKRRFADHV